MLAKFVAFIDKKRVDLTIDGPTGTYGYGIHPATYRNVIADIGNILFDLENNYVICGAFLTDIYFLRRYSLHWCRSFGSLYQNNSLFLR